MAIFNEILKRSKTIFHVGATSHGFQSMAACFALSPKCQHTEIFEPIWFI